jgi:hypothetical protein
VLREDFGAHPVGVDDVHGRPSGDLGEVAIGITRDRRDVLRTGESSATVLNSVTELAGRGSTLRFGITRLSVP